MAYPQNLPINQANIKTILLDFVYPIGSIYLSLKDTNPKTYLGGEWEKLPEGKALWTASSGVSCTSNSTTDNTNNSIAAGLPNITGNIGTIDALVSNLHTGAFNQTSTTTTIQNAGLTEGGRWGTAVKYSSNLFDASRSNSIYGNSNTVQPPAYKIYAWRRTK